jgi:DNA mismatch repair protein MutS
MGKLTPAMQQYFDLTEQHKDAVLFFQLGDFYEMFGEQAVEVSRLLDITLTSRNKGKENELAMCGVPLKAAPGYIAKLTQMGRKVAICDQVSDSSEKGLVQREVVQIVTPGTTFDETILDQKKSQYLSAVVESKGEYALATADITTGSFRVTKLENKQALLEELYRLSSSEILVSGVEESLEESLSDLAYVTKFSAPAWKEAEEILTKQFKTIGLESFGLEKESLLSQAAANLLFYLQETQKSTLGHLQAIEVYETGEYMLLDESTMRNLDLFYNQHSGQLHGTVIDAIDQTKTSMGGRLLRFWLAHPLIKAEQIIERQDAVEQFVLQTNQRLEVRENLETICDLERLVGKVGTQRVNPRDLYNLKETLLKIPAIKTSLETLAKSSSLVKLLLANLHDHLDTIELIQTKLVDEPPVMMQEGGYIREGVNKELDELRAISKSGKDWISQMQLDEMEKTGIPTLKVKFNKVFGYYIEVSKSHVDKVPDNYTRKQTLVNAERYITPELKEYEEKVLGAQEKIETLEYEEFVTLREEIFAHVGKLQETAKALAAIDVLSSLAELAVLKNYAKPELQETSILEIKQGRHAVIEHIQKAPYIPNDLVLDESRFILLTGPNMSGKSSYLRQVALMVLLAQIGSYVPAESMKWSVVDRIFTRVGASDNLAAGRSTFMVEMQEAAYILNHATEHSLVILDELGRGTSTYDGLSLAWAISEYLHDIIKSKTLFATHYHELIEIIDDLKQAENFSVVVGENEDGVVFLHQIQKGGVSKSYGIEVAKLAGLPQNLILRSKDLLKRLEEHAWEQDAGLKQPSLPLMPVAKQSEHPVVQKLKEIDPNSLTPLQALQLLNEYKNEIE